MLRIFIILFFITGLTSCVIPTTPREYVIIIDGNHGVDLSGAVPVKIIGYHPPETPCSKMIPFLLPVRPIIPVFSSTKSTTNKMVVEALARHIEQLHDYIKEMKESTKNDYTEHNVRCHRS
jgi:hypothetical protein